MLDTRNRAKPYPDLAEQCRRLAASTPFKANEKPLSARGARLHVAC